MFLNCEYIVFFNCYSDFIYLGCYFMAILYNEVTFGHLDLLAIFKIK